jgi:hypothetical protein
MKFLDETRLQFTASLCMQRSTIGFKVMPRRPSQRTTLHQKRMDFAIAHEENLKVKVMGAVSRHYSASAGWSV